MAQNDLRGRIEALEAEERDFLKLHKQLEAEYERTGFAAVRQRASAALNEAQKRRARVAELRKKERGSN